MPSPDDENRSSRPDAFVERVLREGRARLRRHRARRAVAGGLALALVSAGVGYALAQAGGSTQVQTATSPSSTTTTVPRSTTSSSTSTSTTSPTTNTATTTATTTATSPAGKQLAPCRTDQLKVSITGQVGATGHQAAIVLYQNVSSSSCTLDGYPKVTASNAQGQTTATSTHVTPGTVEFIFAGHSAPPVRLVTIAPGATAPSYLIWGDGGPPGPCVDQPTEEAVTPPGDHQQVVLHESMPTAVCGVSTSDGIPVTPDAFGVTAIQPPGYVMPDVGP